MAGAEDWARDYQHPNAALPIAGLGGTGESFGFNTRLMVRGNC